MLSSTSFHNIILITISSYYNSIKKLGWLTRLQTMQNDEEFLTGVVGSDSTVDVTSNVLVSEEEILRGLLYAFEAVILPVSKPSRTDWL